MKNYSSIGKNQAFCWLVSRLIGSAFLFAFCGILPLVLIIIDDVPSVVKIISVISLFALMLLLFIYTFIMPFLQQAAWKYIVCDDFIEVRYGVITKTVKIVPEARIQHLTVVRSIGDRIFGMSKISVTTANGAITILGLNPKFAEELAHSVNDRVNTLIRQGKMVGENMIGGEAH